MWRPDLRSYLGRRVTILIDRPLGSAHPRCPDLHHPVNYGYLPGTMSGDGQPIDAYVLGVNKPQQQAEGVVIAVMRRADVVEDKLVVAPPGCSYSATQIKEMTAFQERYFDSAIITL